MRRISGETNPAASTRRFTAQLAIGSLYNRDLPALKEPIRNLANNYIRRVDSSQG